MFKKNTAVTGFPFGMVSTSTGAAITTGTVSGFYTLDGGTQTAIAGTPVHEGNGQWSVNLTAAEMNGDIVGLTFTHSGDGMSVYFTIKTDTKLVSDLQDVAITDIVSDSTAFAGAQVGQIKTNVDTILGDVAIIERSVSVLSTTIATLASQVSFTLTAGSANDDVYNGLKAVITDSATPTQKAHAQISDYAGSTKTITLASDPGIFTMAVGDTIDIVVVPTVVSIRQEMDNSSTKLSAIQTTVDGLNDISVSDILTTQMTEAYAADGVAPTVAQALFLIQQSVGDFAISGTTLSVKGLDGSTVVATYTLDDATDATLRTRAS